MADQPTEAEETTGAPIINSGFGHPGTVAPEETGKEQALAADATPEKAKDAIIADTAVQGAEPDES